MESNNELSNINTDTQTQTLPIYQYYSEANPVNGELVLVEFTEECDGFFKAKLLEYQYSGMINFQDITKKRRVQSFKKFVPLNKNMVARVENVDSKALIAQLSLAYLDEGNNSKDSTTNSIQEKLLVYFQENKQMESFVKTLCIINKYNYIDVWTKIIHEIDRRRRIYNDEENEEDNDISIWTYFNNHIDDLKQWFNTDEFDESLCDSIIELHKKKTVKPEERVLTKIGIISFGGVESTKELLGRAFKDLKYNFTCKYLSTPDYIFESSSVDSAKEDHETLVKFLQTEGQKLSPKIFVDAKFVGLNAVPVEAENTDK